MCEWVSAEVNMSLEGKVTLVTGAGSGIGRAIATLFAQEGATVVIMSRREAILEQLLGKLMSEGGEGLVIAGDVSDPEICKMACEKVYKAYGKFDILVNNAAVLTRGKCVDTSTEEWDSMLQINLSGPFHMCRNAIPYMLKSRGGVILNISSVVALVGEINLSAYCATKSAMTSFTKSIALDYGKQGIRANTICPAYIETDLNRDHLANLRADKEKWARIIEAHPIGRLGTPEDVAYAARFLCCDEAKWITGIDLPVDGGYLAR
jgi:meso-butanediol dehydrogenase/(S,S)-butanediol dehydrogenase/diacetyl reductase